MLSKKAGHDRLSYELISIDECVPEDHLLRSIERHIDFSFIYELVEPLYSKDMGRPSLDPVLLIKIPIIQYLFGISSMRRTIEEIKVNMAYRWFLGLGFSGQVPHFTTFGKNYKRRFEGTELFEEIFERILLMIVEEGFIDPSLIFVDSTPVKASANRNKRRKIRVKREIEAYEKRLQEEINAKRLEDGMKEFDYDDKDDDPDGDGYVDRTISPRDPDCGMLFKGEHKRDFAYGLNVGCDKNGWILGFDVFPANTHDSRAFHEFFPKLRSQKPSHLVMDAGYKNPTIARLLEKEGIIGVFPYTRAKGTKKDGFGKREFIYLNEEDVYQCPAGERLGYRRINRDGYMEYEASSSSCEACGYKERCLSKSSRFRKINRHLHEGAIDRANVYRKTPEGRELYYKRKETIERSFAEGKENHGLGFTRQVGKRAMEFKAALTLACMNMKKYVKVMDRRQEGRPSLSGFFSKIHLFMKKQSPEIVLLNPRIVLL